jgi:hypothetical protein
LLKKEEKKYKIIRRRCSNRRHRRSNTFVVAMSECVDNCLEASLFRPIFK